MVGLGDRSGEVLDGRYRLDKLLGEGGIGQVYVGAHVITGRKVAVKFLHDAVSDNAEIVGRFYREARAATAIGSKHICEVLDMRPPEQGQPFLVMEYLEGEDLRVRLQREMRIEPAEAVEIFHQILDGLAAAHDAAIVHRDIKPENIFLLDESAKPSTAKKADNSPLVKILDFGVSKYHAGEDSELTVAGAILGSPHYMSPEQAGGDIELGPPADIYSVGVMLHEVLTGEVPFDAPSFSALVIKIATEAPPHAADVRPGLPRELGDIALKAMARAAGDRYATAREMRAALANVSFEDDGYERDVPPTLVPTRGKSASQGGMGQGTPEPSMQEILPADGLPVPSFDDGSFYEDGVDDDDDEAEEGATEIGAPMQFEGGDEYAPTEQNVAPQHGLPEPTFGSTSMPVADLEKDSGGLMPKQPQKGATPAPATPSPKPATPTPAPAQVGQPKLGLLPDDPTPEPGALHDQPLLGSPGSMATSPVVLKSNRSPMIYVGAALLAAVVAVVSVLVVNALSSGGDEPEQRRPPVVVTNNVPNNTGVPPTKTPPTPPDPVKATPAEVPPTPVPDPIPAASDAGAEASDAATAGGDAEAIGAAADAGPTESTSDADVEETEDADVEEEERPPDTFRVVVRVNPSVATIYVDGRPVEGNPAIVYVPTDHASHEIETWAQGYRRQETRFMAFEDREVSLTLERLNP